MTHARLFLLLGGVFLMLGTDSFAFPGRDDDSARMSDPTLTAWYQQFNKLYFGGKLPTKEVYVDWGPGTGTWLTHYEDEPLRTMIYVGEYLRGKQKYVCMDILHEMAHAEVRRRYPHRSETEGADADGNDKEFQATMLRLAKKGAFKNCW